MTFPSPPPCSPDDDSMPDWVLQRTLQTLEPHREVLEPLLRAAQAEPPAEAGAPERDSGAP